MDSLAAPDGSYVPLGDHAHASFHDLGPEEKRKVAKLIRQVVELSEARAKLEKELETLKGRCATEEGARRDAETAEANGRAEIESLRTRLDEALATINALGGGHAGMLGMGPSGELTITPLPDTPARRAAAPNTAVSPASAGKDSPAAVGLVTEPTEESIASPSIAPAGSPPETIVVRTNATETTPKPSTPPAAVLAAAKERAAAAENAANTPPNTTAKTTAELTVRSRSLPRVRAGPPVALRGAVRRRPARTRVGQVVHARSRRAQRRGSQDRPGFRGFRWIIFVVAEPGDPDGSYRDPNRRDASRGGDAHGDGLESVFRRDDEHDALPRQRGSGSDPG
jgi:hypothetical protein